MNSRLSQLLLEDFDNFNTKVELNMFSGDLVKLGLLDNSENFDSFDTKEVEVVWNCELVYRSWGIDTSYITAPDQNITIVYNRIVNEDGDTDRETIEVPLKDIKVNNREMSFPLAPSELSFYHGKWELSFN